MKNKKWKKFVDEYMLDMNASRAYVAAGYSNKTPDKNAYKLLEKKEIKERIAELQAKTAKKLEITREATLKKAVEITELYDEVARLAMLDDPTLEEELKYSRLVAIIKASDSNKAIDTILRAQGWNAPDKSEVEHKGIEGINITIKRNRDKEEE